MQLHDCDLLCPVQNTKPLWSPNAPKLHPEPSPETKIRKKYTKKYTQKSGVFVYFSYNFFRSLVSGEDSGCILGRLLGIRGVLYSVRGAGDRNYMNDSHVNYLPNKCMEYGALILVPECTKIARFSAVAASIFTAPRKIARCFEAPWCVISSAKIASEPRFLLRRKWVKMVLAAEFLAIPSSAVKNR